MILYLQYNVGLNRRYLSENNVASAGTVQPTSQGANVTVDYMLNRAAQKLLRSNTVKLQIDITSLGHSAILPSLLLRTTKQDGTLEYANIVEGVLEVQNTTFTDSINSISESLNWEFELKDHYTLEDKDLVLRFFVDDLTEGEGTPSSFTFNNTSKMNVSIVEGEGQQIDAYTRAKFSFFQRTEKIFAYTRVDLKEEVTLTPATRVRSVENVVFEAYTRVKLYEAVEYPVETRVTLRPEYINSDPHVTNVEMGSYTLPTWAGADRWKLRKKENLFDIAEELGVNPDPIIPLEVPKIVYPDASLSVTAQLMVDTFEMLKSSPDDMVDATYQTTGPTYDVPGERFKVKMPESTQLPVDPDTIRYSPATKEWVMPIGFEASIRYTLPLGFVPKSVQPKVSANEFNVELGASLWFLVRHRDVGANLGAFFKGKPGIQVLNKKVTSDESIIVWVWDNVTGPFDVNLYVSNDSTRRPGFAGTSAALMIA